MMSKLAFVRLSLFAPLSLFVSCAAPTALLGNSDRSGDVFVRAQYGLGLLADGKLNQRGATGSVAGDAEYDAGTTAGLAVGYRINPGWSVEGELTYRSNDLDSWRAANGGAVLADGGDFASLSFMANARYHFPVSGRLRPYVGAGVGLVEEIDVDLEIGGAGNENGFSDSALGLQGIVGADYLLSDSWSVSAEGRYFTALGFDLEGEGAANDGTQFDADYNHFGLQLGVTYSF